MTKEKYELILRELTSLAWFTQEQATDIADKWFNNANADISDGRITDQCRSFCVEMKIESN